MTWILISITKTGRSWSILFWKNVWKKKGISRVDEAMAYSLLAGGKRIRPIILMATADALGVSGYNFLPVACGLEMIHTYSLIHDDLPCMDDDEYRRGRLTNHKVLGKRWRFWLVTLY